MKNGIKIMIIDGNNIKKYQEGRYIKREYKGVFADSLLLNKLKELGIEEKLGQTNDIIGLEFVHKYISENANKIIEDIIQYQIDNKEAIDKVSNELKDLKNKRDFIQENKKIKDLDEENKIIVKEFNKQIKSKQAEKKIFTDKIKEIKGDISDSDIMNKKDIRVDLYENKFSLDFYKYNKETLKFDIFDKTIRYRFWFRSPSKSKTGDVIFINEKLFDEINEWQTMGIKLKEDIDGNVLLVENEAYKSLTSSSKEGTFILDPSSILVLNDLDSYSEYNCSIVDVYKKGEKVIDIKDANGKIIDKIDYKGQTYVKNGLHNLKNTIFDGQSIGDISLFTGEYKGKGMIVARQHYFKTCIFNGNVRQFFIDWCESNKEDYNTYQVKDRYGNMINVRDILLLTTENSLKWEKFLGHTKEAFNIWKKVVNRDNNIFGICKTTHESKYGDLQRMSFQMVNTLPLETDNDITEVVKTTIDYVNSMKGTKNIDKFINYAKATKNDTNSNEMMIDLYNRNNDFASSFLFTKFKKTTLISQKEDIRAGKLYANGGNLTIVGSPYAMLLHSVGQVPNINNVISDDFEDITLPIINNECISVYTKMFEEEELASFRSPHNSPNNIGFNKNFKHELMEKYFNFDENIMAINEIRTNEQDKKNSEDQDSDFNFVTNTKVIVEASKRAQSFPTIVNNIPQSHKRYKNTMHDLALIDDNLSKSRGDIGISSNLAQIAMSWYWNDKTQYLADYVTILSTIAQCSIDSSKRQYEIEISKEIIRIRKDIDKASPMFWKYVNETIQKMNKEEKAEAVEKLVDCKCPMNLIQSEIDKIKIDSKPTRIKDIKFINDIKGKKNTTMYNKIVKIAKEYNTANDRLHISLDKAKKDSDKDKINAELSILKENIIRDFSEVKLGTNSKNNEKNEIAKKTMQMLILSCLYVNGENREYCSIILNNLYRTHKKSFLDTFIKK